MRSIILFIALLAMSGIVLATETAITAVWSMDNLNDYTAAPGSWTALNGNGSTNYYQWPAGYDLFLLVNVTGVLTPNHLDIIAGDNPPAFRSGIGNLTISGWTDGGSEVRCIGPLESARFSNETGYLFVGSHNLTGKVAILRAKE